VLRKPLARDSKDYPNLRTFHFQLLIPSQRLSERKRPRRRKWYVTNVANQITKPFSAILKRRSMRYLLIGINSKRSFYLY